MAVLPENMKPLITAGGGGVDSVDGTCGSCSAGDAGTCSGVGSFVAGASVCGPEGVSAGVAAGVSLTGSVGDVDGSERAGSMTESGAGWANNHRLSDVLSLMAAGGSCPLCTATGKAHHSNVAIM